MVDVNLLSHRRPPSAEASCAVVSQSLAAFQSYFPPVAVATSTSREDDRLECSFGMQIPSLGFAIGKCKHLQEQDVT